MTNGIFFTIGPARLDEVAERWAKLAATSPNSAAQRSPQPLISSPQDSATLSVLGRLPLERTPVEEKPVAAVPRPDPVHAAVDLNPPLQDGARVDVGASQTLVAFGAPAAEPRQGLDYRTLLAASPTAAKQSAPDELPPRLNASELMDRLEWHRLATESAAGKGEQDHLKLESGQYVSYYRLTGSGGTQVTSFRLPHGDALHVYTDGKIAGTPEGKRMLDDVVRRALASPPPPGQAALLSERGVHYAPMDISYTSQDARVQERNRLAREAGQSGFTPAVAELDGHRRVGYNRRSGANGTQFNTAYLPNGNDLRVYVDGELASSPHGDRVFKDILQAAAASPENFKGMDVMATSQGLSYLERPPRTTSVARSESPPKVREFGDVQTTYEMRLAHGALDFTVA